MRNLSTEFRRQLYYGNRKYLAYADITLTDGTELNLTNSEIWSGGFSIEQAVSDDDKFTALGSVIIGSATVIINNIEETYSEYDFTNATVVLRVGLQLSSNTEIIKLGTYRVDDATYNGGTITLSLLDYMEQFDRPYVTTLTYPNRLDMILNDCCTKCGVQLLTVDFPNKTTQITIPPDGNAVTFREVVSWIATIAGCYAYCNENGQLVLDWFDTDSLINNSGIDGGKFDITTASRYQTGDSADGGGFNPWSAGYPAVVDGGEFTENLGYHLIYNLKSQNICVDDTVITGISLIMDNVETTDGVVTDGSDTNKITITTQDKVSNFFIGTEGYVIQIEGNEFLHNDNMDVKTILRYLANKIIGLTFCKMNITTVNDPSIEAGDVAKVFDRKGNEYNILVTRATFAIGRYQTIVCGSDTPLRNSATRFSQATKNYIKSKKLLKTEQTTRTQLLEEVATALSEASGLNYYEEEQPDGTKIYYLHDKPTLAQSKVVWKLAKNAFGVTNNYNGAHPEQTVWNAGLAVSGNLVANILSAHGVDADWITTGTISSKDGSVSINLDNNTINLKGVTSFTDFATKTGLSRSGYTTISGSNITTGIIQSPLIDPEDTSSGRNFSLNLLNGQLTMKKGSIDIGDGAFKVTTAGILTANGATINGTIWSTTGTDYAKIEDARLQGGKMSVNGSMTSYGAPTGYLSFNQLYTNTGRYGIRVAGRGMLALMTEYLGISRYYEHYENATIEIGQSKTISYVSNVSLTLDKTWIQDVYSGQDVAVVTGVSVNLTKTDVKFTKGVMVTQ